MVVAVEEAEVALVALMEDVCSFVVVVVENSIFEIGSI